MRIGIILLCFIGNVINIMAQMYSQPNKTVVKTEIKAKEQTPKDTSKFFMSTGFILNAAVSVNRGMSSGDYRIRYYDNKQSTAFDYAIKNSYGYRLGIGVGFKGKKFALEMPIMFCVDRYQVPEISSYYKLNILSLESGFNQYFMFGKGKHYILFGEYITFTMPNLDLFEICSYGINLGYGYNIMERLNVSIRSKLDFIHIFGENKPVVEIEKDYGTSDNVSTIHYINEYSNSLQLVVRYDLINTRKLKSKIRKPKHQQNQFENYNTQNNYYPPPPQQNTVDYSGYSDADLNLALKEATAKSDLDAMLAISKENDKRKARNELAKSSDVQLKEQLTKALEKEDYEQAELIKKEIAKRAKQNAMPAKDDLDSKSIEELIKLKNEAVSKDDFDTAQKIQLIINKKKQ